ncbi:p35 [Palpita vitrealis nucleopolyhedrovirus]|uniref:P35 n=1 Tax=Palpita vitrealis nucleopolyhedrovirus TaxID=2951960 RepID=A0AAE9LNL9_9ABAC|nr:p35 [Palpita vitrealis nucleopolyhedrovirus]
MCVIFPVEINVSQTVIRDRRLDNQTRELVYINKIMDQNLTKPVLMMFNISGPILTVARNNKKMRDEIQNQVDKQFDLLERDYSTQFDGTHTDNEIEYFKDEYYSVSCQKGSVLKTEFVKILENHDYVDKESIEKYQMYCLPQLVNEDDDVYVALCVLKPGFEKGNDQVLSFEYKPLNGKVILPISHEINDKGLYKYDVVAYVDNVMFDNEQFKEFVNSFTIESNIIDKQIIYYNQVSQNKKLIYKAVEFVRKNENWKLKCNGFIYETKSNDLYVKLCDVTSSLNKNVILNIK